MPCETQVLRLRRNLYARKKMWKEINRENAAQQAGLETISAQTSANAGGKNMTNLSFDKEATALLLIDPYNDFISEGGKLWDRIKSVAEANDCISHMLQLLTEARETGVRVFFAMHHRYRLGDYETWKYAAPIQKAAGSGKTFEYETG